MADRSVVYRLKADVTQFRAQMASAAASVKDAGDKMTATDKNGAKFRRGLDTLGGTAGRIGLVAAVGLGAAVVKAANFEQAMSHVAAATHESTANMERLRAAALEAGAETVFSATEAADGIEQLSKAGVATADILSGGLRGALDLAAAGNQSVGEAAETAATAMTQFGLSGEKIPHIADLLAAGAGKAQGEVSDLAAALKQGGLVAAQMGLSIEDTTGTLAAFAAAGLVGSDAGTSFKSMIQRLQNPLGQGAKAMERLGINAYDAQGNFVGIAAVAGQLQSKLGGLTQAQRDAALAQIFGSDAVRAATVLYKNGASGIQGWIDKTNDAGYAGETAAIKLDNLKGDLEAFGGALETALIGTGGGSQGPLRDLVQNLTDVTNAYNNLPQGAKSAATSVLGFTAVAGGGIYVFSKLVGGIASTREAMGQLGLSSGKTGAALSKVGRGATIAASALAGLAVIDAVQSGFGKAGPGVEAMTKSLLGLRVAASLPKDLDGISDSIDRLANPNKAQALQDNISDALGGIGGGSELREARGQIEALDAALTNLVTSAGPKAASSTLSNLAASAGLSKAELGDLKGLLPSYNEALTGAANEATLASSATSGLASATQGAASAAQASASAIQANVDAMRAQRNAAIEAGNAAIAYEAAIDDARAAVKANGRTLDITTEKGRANRSALLNLAGAWNNQSNAAKNTSGAHRAAVGTFVRAAVAMGMGERQARAYARRLLEIPPKRSTKITVDTAGASAEINRFRTLAGRPIHTAWHVRRTGAAGVGLHQAQADGGTLGRIDAGGTIPGAREPYGDKTLLLGAPGEEVISNRYGQADRHRALLKAINANRYADGGTIGRSAAASPNVNVGGTTVRVFIGNTEVNAIVDSRIDSALHAESAYQKNLARTDR